MKEQVILLHGAIGSKEQLIPLQNELENKYTVHNFNFSGHGRNDFEIDFSIMQFATELIDYINKNNILKPIVFGYSMGGYVAIYAESLKPNSFSKIITLATKFEWSNEIASREILQIDATKIKLKIPGFAEILKQRHYPNDWELVLEKTKNLMINLGANPLLTIQVLNEIQIPTMLLIGDSDEMVSIQETEFTNKNLPNSTLQILPNTKHAIEKVDVVLLSKLI